MQLISIFFFLIKQEILLAFRFKMEWLNPLVFFVVVVTLFPLAISPDTPLLHTIAPGIIWIAAFLAMLLSLNLLFRHDYEEGFLTLMLLSPNPLPMLVFAKVFAHWLISTLPLIIVTPVLALLLHLSGHEIVILLITLLLGTPIFSFLGAIAMGLIVGLGSNNVLLALLILPLAIPVLIFGAGAVVNADTIVSVNGQLALLGALLILAIVFAPLTIAAALKIDAN